MPPLKSSVLPAGTVKEPLVLLPSWRLRVPLLTLTVPAVVEAEGAARALGGEEGSTRVTRLGEGAAIVEAAAARSAREDVRHKEGQVDLVINGALVGEGATIDHEDEASAVDHSRLMSGIVDACPQRWTCRPSR